MCTQKDTIAYTYLKIIEIRHIFYLYIKFFGNIYRLKGKKE